MGGVTGAALPFDPIEEARRQWIEHGWADVADGMAAVTSIMRAQQLFLGRVDSVLRPYDLTFARYELLMLLVFSRTGALPLSRIGTRLQVHATSVTSAVDRLERQGFVRRRPHPTDGRTTLAELTADGREVAARATSALYEQVFAAPGLADEQLRALFSVLRDLRRQAGDF